MWQRYNQATHIFEKSLDNGSTWAQMPLNASIITEGTLSPSVLPPASANIAYTNVSNVFTLAQTFNANETYFAAPTFARLHLRNTTDPAGSQTWHIINYQGRLQLAVSTDDGVNWTPGSGISIDRTSNLHVGMQIFTVGGIFPGTGVAEQTSWYIYGSATYGLATNAGLYVGGSAWCAGNIFNTAGYVFPGRWDGGAGGTHQLSWFLASHGTYGLYSNTGLYTEGAIWTASTIGAASWLYSRGQPQGCWQSFAATFNGSGGGASSTNVQLRYAYVGQIMFVYWYITGITFGAGCGEVYLSLPQAIGGAGAYASGTVNYHDGANWGHVSVYAIPGEVSLRIFRPQIVFNQGGGSAQQLWGSLAVPIG